MIKKSDKKNVKKCIRTNFNFYLCLNLYAMLVPTMTTEEVCKEIKNDYPAFYEKCWIIRLVTTESLLKLSYFRLYISFHGNRHRVICGM